MRKKFFIFKRSIKLLITIHVFLDFLYLNNKIKKNSLFFELTHKK